MPANGHCLCGQIQYHLNNSSRLLDLCHCKNCQRQGGNALLATLKEGLGEKFTSEIRAAWIVVFRLIATTMKAEHERCLTAGGSYRHPGRLDNARCGGKRLQGPAEVESFAKTGRFIVTRKPASPLLARMLPPILEIVLYEMDRPRPVP